MLFLSGCTPERARALQTMATQLDLAAENAVRVLGEIPTAQISVPSRTKDQAAQRFADEIINSLYGPDADTISVLGLSEIDVAMNPDVGKLDLITKQAWTTYLHKISEQYGVFSSIYENLHKGYLGSVDPVRKSRPIAVKLIAQMFATAEKLQELPPRFLAERTLAIRTLQRGLDGAETNREKVAILKESYSIFLDIERREMELQRRAVVACLKSAEAGRLMLVKIDQFDDMNIEDIL